MKVKNISKQILLPLLLVLIIIGFSSFAIFLASDGDKVSMETYLISPVVETTVSPPIQTESRLPLPVRLKIPVINVDAPVESVGLLEGGVMGLPKSIVDVAWFNSGTIPGEVGSAVFAGHYGWKNNQRAVFDTLYTLRKGDKVFVEDEKGIITPFVVRETRRYNSNSDAKDVFVSSDGKAHLNLVTCEGEWNKETKSYSTRLVVFTDKSP
jgi:LPXTG-site transpeptidase (sortase) family protein